MTLENDKTKLKKSPSQLTGVDYDILTLVQTFHYLTAEQIVRLRYSKNSLPTAQMRLKALYEANYLERRKLPHVGTGNTEYLYYLSTKAVQEAGRDVFSRVRKSDIDHMQFPHLHHLLSLNDFPIAATLLPRFVPAITLVEMRHDLDLKKTPVVAEMRVGASVEHVSVVPDGWLDFVMTSPDIPKPRRRCLVVELDRGTISIAPFKQKIRALYHYAISEKYEELYGTDLCMVTFATTSGENRLRQMITWCEQELERQNLVHEANLFRFAALPAGEYNPQEIYLSEMWYKPFEEEPVSLLWQASL